MHNLRLPYSILAGILILTSTLCAQTGRVVINEINMNANDVTGDNTFAYNWPPNSSGNTYCREYVEIYNPDPCYELDISCYTLGSHMGRIGGDQVDNYGAFTLPEGTVLQPLQKLVIGGVDMDDAGPDDILLEPGDNFCMSEPSGFFPPGRWYMRNTYGWIAIYDRDGNPVNAVHWNEDNNATPWNDASVAEVYTTDQSSSCVCEGTQTLLSLKGIYDLDPTLVEFAGLFDDDIHTDEGFSRQADGSSDWIRSAATKGECNDPNECYSPHEIELTTVGTGGCTGGSGGDCDGEIVVNNLLSLGAGHVPISSTYTIEVYETSDPTNIVGNTWDAPNTNGLPGVDLANAAEATISDLCGGVYEVVVTDHTGCEVKETVNIGSVTPLVSLFETDPVKCNGDANGVIRAIDLSGFNDDFVLTIDGNPFTVGSGDIPFSTTLEDLAPGEKDVSIVHTMDDGTECREDLKLTIGEPDALDLTVATSNVSCPGLSDGAIDLSAITGGTNPYDVGVHLQSDNSSQFSQLDVDGNWSHNESMAVGQYYYRIEDDNECDIQVNFEITEPAAFEIELSDENSECQQANGIINIDRVAGANGPGYKVALFENDGTTQVIAQENITGTPHALTGLMAGAYKVEIEDANGCVEVVDGTVSDNPASLPLTPDQQDATCANAGYLELDYTGNNGPVSYTWTDPDGNTLSDTDGRVDAPNVDGTYSYVVTDQLNCTRAGTMDFASNIYNLETAHTSKESECEKDNGGNYSGEAHVTVNNGAAPYTYVWQGYPAETTGDLIGIPVGDYVVDITDAEGCTGQEQIRVDGVGFVTFELLSNPDTCEGGYGSVRVVNLASESDPINPQYDWIVNGVSDGTQGDTVRNVATGDVELTIEDDMGCISTVVQAVGNVDDLLPNGYSESNVTQYGEYDTGAQIDLSYNMPTGWSVTGWQVDGLDVDGTDEISISEDELGVHQVSIFVESPHGCAFTMSGEFLIKDYPRIYVPNAFFALDSEVGAGEGVEAGNYSFYPVFSNTALFDDSTFEGYIFNRWGEVVYTFSDINDVWKGRMEGGKSGELLEIETYVYKFVVKEIVTDQMIQKTGHVTVIR